MFTINTFIIPQNSVRISIKDHLKFWSKIEIFLEYRNFSKNRNVRHKSKYSSKIKILLKLEMFSQNRDFSEKLNSTSEIEVLFENGIFC